MRRAPAGCGQGAWGFYNLMGRTSNIVPPQREIPLKQAARAGVSRAQK